MKKNNGEVRRGAQAVIRALPEVHEEKLKKQKGPTVTEFFNSAFPDIMYSHLVLYANYRECQAAKY
jgi:hypothetical protein